jgi:predicted nuclease of predicted toxin-antitoxin system
VSLLIDENLSFRLKRLLTNAFPGCRHVADFGLLTADDRQIYDCARDQGLALLSKDDDFRERVEREGPPPKLVFVRLGNVSTTTIAAAIIAQERLISAFLSTPETDVFIISPPVAL